MINLQTEKSKAPTRVLSEIAKENNLNYVLVGAYDENITEKDFNKVVWLSPTQTMVGPNEKSLPSPITWAEFKQRLEDYLVKLVYTSNRKQEYPTIEDQLDTIFHHGIDVWKQQIQAVKDKHPKP